MFSLPRLSFPYLQLQAGFGAAGDYPLTPQSSDRISSRVNSIRTCYIFNYGQRLDYGKGKGFQARVQCAVVKSRKEEKIGGYADISGVNIFS